MTEPFIKNHQLNIIKKQGRHIQHCLHEVRDARIIQAVKGQAEHHVMISFSSLREEEKEIISSIKDVGTSIEVEAFIGSVYPYVIPFPKLDKEKIKTIFPHRKKMRLPNLSAIDFSRLTYLGWNDPGQQKKYIIYEWEGNLIGIEGRYHPRTQQNYCYFCHHLTPVTLISFQTSPSKSDRSDYYRSIGQYICMDSEECNKKIMDTQPLESFIQKLEK